MQRSFVDDTPMILFPKKKHIVRRKSGILDQGPSFPQNTAVCGSSMPAYPPKDLSAVRAGEFQRSHVHTSSSSQKRTLLVFDASRTYTGFRTWTSRSEQNVPQQTLVTQVEEIHSMTAASPALKCRVGSKLERARDFDFQVVKISRSSTFLLIIEDGIHHEIHSLPAVS